MRILLKCVFIFKPNMYRAHIHFANFIPTNESLTKKNHKDVGKKNLKFNRICTLILNLTIRPRSFVLFKIRSIL